MATITLKVPDAVNVLLESESARRQISKSALVREAIERTLLLRPQRESAARRWLQRWSGALVGAESLVADDSRLEAILAKHLK